MLRLAKAFWDISLWRRTPEQLPASLFLLSLVAGAAALLEVLSALQPPVSIPQIFARGVLSVALPLAFVWAALLLAHRPHRFLQTSIAVLGVDVLAGLILYPIGSLMHFIGPIVSPRCRWESCCWPAWFGICSPAPTSGAAPSTPALELAWW